MAIECALGYADGYTQMYNNYFLFNNPQTQKFEFLPYDYDFCLDRDAPSGEYNDWADVNVYRWGNFSRHRSRGIF